MLTRTSHEQASGQRRQVCLDIRARQIKFRVGVLRHALASNLAFPSGKSRILSFTMSEYSNITLTCSLEILISAPTDGRVVDLWITFLVAVFSEEFDRFQLRESFSAPQKTVARKTGSMLGCARVHAFRIVIRRANGGFTLQHRAFRKLRF